jgi:hypothetical protein
MGTDAILQIDAAAILHLFGVDVLFDVHFPYKNSGKILH